MQGPNNPLLRIRSCRSLQSFRSFWSFRLCRSFRSFRLSGCRCHSDFPVVPVISESRVRIFKHLRSPGNRFRQAGNRFLGHLKGLQIRALIPIQDKHRKLGPANNLHHVAYCSWTRNGNCLIAAKFESKRTPRPLLKVCHLPDPASVFLRNTVATYLQIKIIKRTLIKDTKVCRIR